MVVKLMKKIHQCHIRASFYFNVITKKTNKAYDFGHITTIFKDLFSNETKKSVDDSNGMVSSFTCWLETQISDQFSEQ